MAIWYNVWPFGIVWVICYIFSQFGMFGPRKNLTTLEWIPPEYRVTAFKKIHPPDAGKVQEFHSYKHMSPGNR
jgi:hypothetical protein